jgi:hypothetical protein
LSSTGQDKLQERILLRFFELVTNKFYRCDALLDIPGIGYDQFMPTIDTNKDKIINPDEFDNLVLMLKQIKFCALFQAEIVADVISIAHQINRGSAQKTCQNCYLSDSPYFSLLVLTGGACAAFGHLTVKILTIPYCRRKKEDDD